MLIPERLSLSFLCAVLKRYVYGVKAITTRLSCRTAQPELRDATIRTDALGVADELRQKVDTWSQRRMPAVA
jgi:hypothetical protein